MDKYDVIPIKFNGQNYMSWSFHLRNFVEGQGLFGYLDGSITRPMSTTDSKSLANWSKENAKVVTWILNSIDSSLAVALQAYTTAADMWAHLKKVYHQTNKARKFHLDSEIAKYTQGDKSVQEYFNGFLTLWTERDSMLIQTVSSGFLSEALKLQEETHISQFLMNLRPEFESIRSALMNRENSANLDTCFQEVLREELRLTSQRAILEEPKALLAPLPANFALLATPNQKPTQCYECKGFGHLAKNCRKKLVCRYCKRSGHLIDDCRSLQRKNGPHQKQNPSATRQNAPAAFQVQAPLPDTGSTSSGAVSMTPAQIQELIQNTVTSAYASMGFNGGRYQPLSLLAFPAFHSSISQSSSITPSTWFLDSGASNHMTSVECSFTASHPYLGKDKITTANGDQLIISGIGTITLSSVSGQSLPLSNVYFVPKLSANLLSVGQLIDDGYHINFSSTGCVIQERQTGKVIATGSKHGRLFLLDIGHRSLFSSSSPNFNKLWTIWHSRLGHVNNVYLHSLFKNGCLEPTFDNKLMSSLLSSKCATCCLSKSHILPFPIHRARALSSFDIIHTDVWGIAPTLSRTGFKYYVTFIDDHSRFTWIYFMRFKSEVFSLFQKFYNMVHTQFQKAIKILRSDSGGEYMSHDFSAFLSDKGILHQKSCPHTPQQNGVAERKNRHILETVRTLLLESLVPPTFWCDAAQTAVYLLNRHPSSILGKTTPYEALFGHTPSYSHLRVFGCLCFVHLPPTERTKLSPQAAKCLFLGYSTENKGFLCYDQSEKRMRISHNVIFL